VAGDDLVAIGVIGDLDVVVGIDQAVADRADGDDVVGHGQCSSFRDGSFLGVAASFSLDLFVVGQVDRRTRFLVLGFKPVGFCSHPELDTQQGAVQYPGDTTYPHESL